MAEIRFLTPPFRQRDMLSLLPETKAFRSPPKAPFSPGAIATALTWLAWHRLLVLSDSESSVSSPGVGFRSRSRSSAVGLSRRITSPMGAPDCHLRLIAHAPFRIPPTLFSSVATKPTRDRIQRGGLLGTRRVFYAQLVARIPLHGQPCATAGGLGCGMYLACRIAYSFGLDEHGHPGRPIAGVVNETPGCGCYAEVIGSIGRIVEQHICLAVIVEVRYVHLPD